MYSTPALGSGVTSGISMVGRSSESDPWTSLCTAPVLTDSVGRKKLQVSPTSTEINYFLTSVHHVAVRN